MAFYSIVFLLALSSMLVATVLAAGAVKPPSPAAPANVKAESSGKKLKIKVYYEALCTDSMQFIRNPLYYSMIDNDWLKHTDLEFVPYGKVGSWIDPVTNITSLYCEHGITECELNALHACILENNSLEEQLKLLHCLMRSFTTNIDQCASDLNIDVAKAKHCKATRSTPDILYKYAKDTNAVGLSSFPAITFDGVFDEWQQQSIINKFDTVFCRKYKEKLGVVLEKC